MNFTLRRVALITAVFGSITISNLGISTQASVLEFRTAVSPALGGAYLDGKRVDDINGTPYFYQVTDDLRGQFVFLGDLDLTGIEQVVGHHYDIIDLNIGHLEILNGSPLPISILVANNVTIGRETTINVSAIGQYGVAGGGTGGNAGRGGNGGAGGSGGEEHKLATMSYNGGAGHDYTFLGGIGDGHAGGGGDMGGLGGSGEFGDPGARGGNASKAFGHSFQAVGGMFGPQLGFPNGGLPGAGGDGGAGGIHGRGVSEAFGKTGGDGGTGGAGGAGFSGLSGSAGEDGRNPVTGASISGGGAGGGGGGGAGGQGGGGGGGGGQGGGGGGAASTTGNDGGDGGRGGGGGAGGAGSLGGNGGYGGIGGGGGGAFELIALGELRVAGKFFAAGDPGQPSTSGRLAGSGTPGVQGYGGSFVPGNTPVGGPGGRGGHGGDGGEGGAGGDGGEPGAGAGGTIKLAATHIQSLGPQAPLIEVSGGDQGEATRGRFILSQSTPDTAAFTINGGRIEQFRGPRVPNPFFSQGMSVATDTSGSTAPIQGLRTTPDAFGILQDLTPSAPMFDDLLTNAPHNAVAALIRLDKLVGDFSDLQGTDIVLVLNLSSRSLIRPSLAITLGNLPDEFQPLVEGGVEHNPLFGTNNTLKQLPQLGVDDIFAVSIDERDDLSYGLSANGLRIAFNSMPDLQLLQGNVLYLVPEPTTNIMTLLMCGLIGNRRQRAWAFRSRQAPRALGAINLWGRVEP